MNKEESVPLVSNYNYRSLKFQAFSDKALKFFALCHGHRPSRLRFWPIKQRNVFHLLAHLRNERCFAKSKFSLENWTRVIYMHICDIV